MDMPRMKWSIALRLGVLLASFSVFAAILAGYYTFDSSRDRLQGRAERALMATTQVLARHMQAGFGTVARDTSFLASVAAQERDRDRLADVFRASLVTHPAYLQIRFISANDYGLELVRIERQGGVPVRIADDALQEKAHFPFVFEALALPAGEVYVSEFGINHEGSPGEDAVPDDPPSARLDEDAKSPRRVHDEPRPGARRVVAEDRRRRVHVGDREVHIAVAVEVPGRDAVARLDDREARGGDEPVLLPARLLDRMRPGQGEGRDGEDRRLAGGKDAEAHRGACSPVAASVLALASPETGPPAWPRERNQCRPRRTAASAKPISSVIGKAATSVKAAAAASVRSHTASGARR